MCPAARRSDDVGMVARWFLRVSSFPGSEPHAGRWRRALAALTVVLTAGLLSAQTAPITPAEAKAYSDQVKTVCARVASANYALRSRGQLVLWLPHRQPGREAGGNPHADLNATAPAIKPGHYQ